MITQRDDYPTAPLNNFVFFSFPSGNSIKSNSIFNNYSKFMFIFVRLALWPKFPFHAKKHTTHHNSEQDPKAILVLSTWREVSASWLVGGGVSFHLMPRRESTTFLCLSHIGVISKIHKHVRCNTLKFVARILKLDPSASSEATRDWFRRIVSEKQGNELHDARTCMTVSQVFFTSADVVAYE